MKILLALVTHMLLDLKTFALNNCQTFHGTSLQNLLSIYLYILCECKLVFTCVNVQFNVERCIWGAATDFVGIFKNVNLKMCAINFDNFRTDPGELLNGKHKTPT